MPDVLLFGATGYTGELTAHALARRGVSFAIAGRNAAKLEALAAATGGPPVHIATVGDVDSLVGGLDGAKVLITTVGPFEQLGDTAAEAALRAKVHYVDSTGEGRFIARLLARFDQRARDVGIAMAPAMGFDEVPADVAATLATQGLDRPELTLTYAVPSRPSAGTARTLVSIVTAAGPWIEEGRRVDVGTGERRRWAPMPAPLGPRLSISAPLAELRLAPLHLDLAALRVFLTSGRAQYVAGKAGIPLLKGAARVAPVRALLENLAGRVPGPDERARRARWTILAEARAGREFRNIVVQGRDVYGITAEFLSAAAIRMSDEGYDRAGVLAPVPAVDLDVLQKEMIDQGVSIDTYEQT